MDYEEIVKTRGSEWTEDETNVVFEQLMLDVGSFIRFAYCRLLSGDATDKLEQAKDLVQDKLLALYRNLKNYDPSEYRGSKDPLRNYLFTIIANEAVKINGKMMRQPDQSLSEFDQLKEPERLSSKEAAEEIEKYLSRLSPTERQALRLFYLEEMSCEEAAGICGCSAAAFKVRLYRGRRKCRDMRKENDND
jgi:RNA polymerase sigma-70 factor, ECF subfamily